MRDLIFVSLEDWDEIWRRNQFLCACWARRFPDSRILFVGGPQLLPLHLKSGTLGRLLRRRAWRVPGLPNILATYVPKPFFNPMPGGRRLNEAVARAHIAKIARQAGLREPLLWLNPNDSGHLIGRLGERGVVYDITDDWELAEPDGPARALVAARDRDLCRRADLTVVCSQALYDSRLAFARRLLLLPNGVDAAHYEAASRRSGGAWPAPVFGYTGTLHPERIDLNLIVALARAHPEGSVVLIGPNAWQDGSLERAEREVPNLFVVAARPYAQLPRLMAGFDVCIVPHRQSAFVDSLNPIKLWEYLACGKPIVASNVAGFRDYPQFCRIASTPQEFLRAADEALAEARLGPEGEVARARRAEAARHSWESRLDTLLQALREANLAEPNSQGSQGSQGSQPDTAVRS